MALQPDEVLLGSTIRVSVAVEPGFAGLVVAQRLFELFVAFHGINLLLALCYASRHDDRKRTAFVLPLQDFY